MAVACVPGHRMPVLLLCAIHCRRGTGLALTATWLEDMWYPLKQPMIGRPVAAMQQCVCNDCLCAAAMHVSVLCTQCVLLKE